MEQKIDNEKMKKNVIEKKTMNIGDKNMEDFNKKINGAIWDVLNDYNECQVEIGNGWVLKGANLDSPSMFDKGITIGKLDEDGDFVEEQYFIFDGYAQSYADLLEQGQFIVEEMTNDIIEFFEEE